MITPVRFPTSGLMEPLPCLDGHEMGKMRVAYTFRSEPALVQLIYRIIRGENTWNRWYPIYGCGGKRNSSQPNVEILIV